ncbi:hypothetical protein BELL_0373g00040 [Botrytis elliptica]|uniref:Uncharacterized protein n=1 Tax=Botrytis elliptica TaxID=278938 RepID=A0A4Z1JWK4_9HELO|nr:hypothetical protein BELL_0373g00040 [Botrytis elliptica]
MLKDANGEKMPRSIRRWEKSNYSISFRYMSLVDINNFFSFPLPRAGRVAYLIFPDSDPSAYLYSAANGPQHDPLPILLVASSQLWPLRVIFNLILGHDLRGNSNDSFGVKRGIPARIHEANDGNFTPTAKRGQQEVCSVLRMIQMTRLCLLSAGTSAEIWDQPKLSTLLTADNMEKQLGSGAKAPGVGNGPSWVPRSPR